MGRVRLTEVEAGMVVVYRGQGNIDYTAEVVSVARVGQYIQLLVKDSTDPAVPNHKFVTLTYADHNHLVTK